MVNNYLLLFVATLLLLQQTNYVFGLRFPKIFRKRKSVVKSNFTYLCELDSPSKHVSLPYFRPIKYADPAKLLSRNKNKPDIYDDNLKINIDSMVSDVIKKLDVASEDAFRYVETFFREFNKYVLTGKCASDLHPLCFEAKLVVGWLTHGESNNNSGGLLPESILKSLFSKESWDVESDDRILNCILGALSTSKSRRLKVVATLNTIHKRFRNSSQTPLAIEALLFGKRSKSTTPNQISFLNRLKDVLLKYFLNIEFCSATNTERKSHNPTSHSKEISDEVDEIVSFVIPESKLTLQLPRHVAEIVESINSQPLYRNPDFLESSFEYQSLMNALRSFNPPIFPKDTICKLDQKLYEPDDEVFCANAKFLITITMSDTQIALFDLSRYLIQKSLIETQQFLSEFGEEGNYLLYRLPKKIFLLGDSAKGLLQKRLYKCYEKEDRRIFKKEQKLPRDYYESTDFVNAEYDRLAKNQISENLKKENYKEKIKLKEFREHPEIIENLMLKLNRFSKTEGLYRISGNSLNVNRFCAKLELNSYVDTKGVPETELATAIKLLYSKYYGVIATDLCNKWDSIAQDQKLVIEELNIFVENLPRTIRTILQSLIRHWRYINRFSDINSMTIRNLIVSWGSSVIDCTESKQIVANLDIETQIEKNCEKIFSEPGLCTYGTESLTQGSDNVVHLPANVEPY